MGRLAKPVNQMSMKMSKDERATRKKMEDKYVTNKTNPKASPILNKTERKIFNNLKNQNENFTVADSDSLNMLAQYLHMWNRIKQAANDLDIADERTPDLERRMIAIDKQSSQHMTALCIPLSQRLRLANDMTKVMIEEKKLAQMNGDGKQVNPLLELLAEIDDD
ncbi:hypothetical protein [Litchfieldia alkalitelluris]|uniref:hypothetical protein n=1 Tax=Litchfieldia alkalitelluris TaxID=304268 RepID=UPI0009969B51|nr:hypothetical protein [Litchfieldia alkalitelluris]